MSYHAKTLFIFGCYLVVLALGLLLVPNTILVVFGFPPTQEVWIRVMGMLLVFLATYNMLAARAELLEFIRWTVPVRASVIVFFATFAALRLVSPMLILFGVVDLVGAAWTWSALAKQRDVAAQPVAG